MKRNKRTTIKAHLDLAPLTEHILLNMGKEGLAIRKRLKTFYQDRALPDEAPFEPHLEASVCEASSS